MTTSPPPTRDLPGAATVTRTMTTVAADYAGVSAAERETYASTRPHEAVLHRLRARLENGR